MDNQQLVTIGLNSSGKLLFSDCKNLKSVCFSGPVIFEVGNEDEYVSLGEPFCAFSGCKKLWLLEMQESTLKDLNICASGWTVSLASTNWYQDINKDAFIFVSHT